MISATLRQLTYMAEGMSWGQIARETGTTLATLNRYKVGAMDFNAEIKRDIKNAFARIAYGRLKDSGFSVANAKSYSQYRPEIVSAYEAEMRMKIGWLTEGAIASKLTALKMDVSKTTVDRWYDELYVKIQDGMRRSSKDVTEQFDYGL